MIAIKVNAKRQSSAAVRRLSAALADPTAIHARVATDVGKMVQKFVAEDDSHTSAARLGAAPTGHMARTAAKMSFQWDRTAGYIGIPRKSRVRAAFGAFTITPTPGHKWLCRPAHALTYGRQPSEFPQDEFSFAILYAHRPFPVLLFKDGMEKGKVAYWLSKSTNVKEDRTLLPWDEIPEASARVITTFLTRVRKGEPTS